MHWLSEAIRNKRALAISFFLLPLSGWTAETALTGGANANYEYDDNIRVSNTNQITLAGLKLGGFVDMQYSTERLQSITTLRLGLERYNHVDLDTDSDLLKEPKKSDFDNESYYLTSNLSYQWERHTLSTYAQISRDSNLNTQFTDGGLGGLRQVEGATNVDTAIIQPAWRWQLNERQSVETSLSARFTDYQSDRYINYDYYSLQSTWLYVLNERMQIQVRPLASRYENSAAFSITSDTYGLQAGLIWSITEKWELNVLGGATEVSTDYGGRGFFIFNPETGEIEFFELEDEDNNGFTGNGELKFTEERYGFAAKIDVGYSPSSNGYLSESTTARLNFYWKPKERLRVDIDGQWGTNDTSGDVVKNKRTYGEVAIRAGYQFAKDWWISARYRYREQDRDRDPLGSSNGNLISAGVSYKLPKEIL